MRSLTIVTVILLTSACAPLISHGAPVAQVSEGPSAVLVERIEVALANDECVGSLDKWARFYKWEAGPDGPNSNVVEVNLRQAGVFGHRQGRYILKPDPSLRPGEIRVTLDHRYYLVVFASYDVRLDRLSIYDCGTNIRY